jgi:hypothetical protein
MGKVKIQKLTLFQKNSKIILKEQKMANKKFWLGMLVMVLAFGMTVVGCDNGSTSKGEDSNGVFTLTGIPSIYDGKYAYLFASVENSSADTLIVGCQNANMSTAVFTLCTISNGSVSLPMWKPIPGNLLKYFGNDTLSVKVFIYNSQTMSLVDSSGGFVYFINFPSVTFSKGSATKSWSDGEFEQSP